MGMILVGISVLGIVGCCVALLMTGRIFKKQKEQLLEEIEKEEQGGTDEENIEIRNCCGDVLNCRNRIHADPVTWCCGTIGS